MTITFRRSGSGRKPTYRERLTVEDDGSFTMTRVYANARAGRFGGTVPEDDFATLQRAAAEASSTPTPQSDANAPRAPGGSTDRVQVQAQGDDGPSFVTSTHDQPEGAWGALLEIARKLLDDLTAQPVAAIELAADPSTPTATLRHVGTEPVAVDLTRATVSAIVRDASGATSATWQAAIEGGKEDAGGGWEHDIGLANANFELASDDLYVVTVNLTIDGTESHLSGGGGNA